MELIEYLNRTEIEIIKIVEKAGYKIKENTTLCSLSNDYVGFLDKKKKIVIICTNNAKKKEGYTYRRKNDKDSYERTAVHIKKALRHEAAHVAQECNEGNILKIEKKLSMNMSKMKALNGSIKISGEEEKERQAYILEDRPRLLKKELEKYCL
tara:strand:- start:121 stop:579 length:459 start_codon:yes stop_codon:yes gene_type:complete